VRLPRWLDPRTNPAGWSAALGVAYAIWQGITAAQATGPLTWKLVGHVAAGVLWAAVSAYVRSHVTPVADPRLPGKAILDLMAPYLAPPPRPPTVPDPAADRAAESERRWIEARKRGGYTGGGPASEMPPPPTDVPSVATPQPEGKP
jgi:hypothetical protein